MREPLVRALSRTAPSLAATLLDTGTARRIFGSALAISVAPNRIDSKLPHRARGSRSRRFLTPLAEMGARLPLAETDTGRAMRDLWIHREDPRRSEIHRYLSAGAASGRPSRKGDVTLDTAAKIDRYCGDYIAMVEDMRLNGYRPELAADNILVAIAADGALVHLRHGNHRLVLSQIAGLPHIPVDVRHIDPAYLARQAEGDLLAAIRAALGAVAG